MLEGCECIGRRVRRETTPLYDICYIKARVSFLLRLIGSAMFGATFNLISCYMCQTTVTLEH